MMVKAFDFNPASSPEDLTVFNGELFFAASGEPLSGQRRAGRELWKSDGSEEGTVMVKDINSESDSDPHHLSVFGETLYFAARASGVGIELWKSDGTAQGTMLVKDINPGIGSSFSFGNSPFLAEVDGIVYLIADNGTTGMNLWRSDGTEEGTVLVKDINPSSSADISSSRFLATNDGMLFFVADDGTNGVELWKSDGTEEGTLLVKDIVPGVGGSYPSELIEVDGILFFRARELATGYELWKSDGTEAGTMLVKDILPGQNGSLTNPVSSFLTEFNGALFFVADDGITGMELWMSDGTESGTQVFDIWSGARGSIPLALKTVGESMVFSASTEQFGRELWSAFVSRENSSDLKATIALRTNSAQEKVVDLVFEGSAILALKRYALYRSADLELWEPVLETLASTDDRATASVLLDDNRPNQFFRIELVE